MWDSKVSPHGAIGPLVISGYHGSSASGYFGRNRRAAATIRFSQTADRRTGSPSWDEAIPAIGNVTSIFEVHGFGRSEVVLTPPTSLEVRFYLLILASCNFCIIASAQLSSLPKPNCIDTQLPFGPTIQF